MTKKSNNAWVDVRFDPAGWASNFNFDSDGKMNRTVVEWLRWLSVMPIQSGGRVSVPLCITRAQNEPRAEPEQLSSTSSTFAYVLFKKGQKMYSATCAHGASDWI